MERTLSEYFRVNDRGHLQVEDVDCVELVETYGSPLYVTSENQIRYNYRRFYQAFARRYPRVTVLFANKSNSNLAVRRILTQEGAGGDCFGLGELMVSLLGGVPTSKLVMNGSNKGVEEIAAAIQLGVAINVDHPEELELVNETGGRLGLKAIVNLRVLPFTYADPSTLSGDLANIASDKSHDKWGMDRPTLREAAARSLDLRNVRLSGLHCHISRLRPTAEPFRLATELMVQAMAELRDQFGWEPETVDIGGGYAHERDPESQKPAGDHEVSSPEEYAQTIITVLRETLAKYRLSEPHLHLEPGRRLISNSTVLLGRVGIIKTLPGPGSKTWVNIDASTNHCLRTSIMGYHYAVINASRGHAPNETIVNIVGPNCTMDIIAEDRPFPGTKRGDVLAILDTGGYAEVNANQFNSIPRPATVLVHGSEAEIIRRRETIQDILATQELPPRLMGATTPGKIDHLRLD
jgi:diaminopimelate decarboxylase